MLGFIYNLRTYWCRSLVAVVAFLSFWSVQLEAAREFSCMLWENQPYSKLYYKNGQDMEVLELISDRRSKLYEMRNMDTLELYIEEEQPNGPVKMKLVGQATFSPKVDRMLFIIRHMPKRQGLPLAIMGINDSLDVFPAGSFRVVNFTANPMSASMGKESKEIQPRKVRVLQPDLPKDGGLVSFIVSDKDGKPVFGRRVLGQSKSRQMIFILSDTEAGRVKAKMLPDIVEDE